MTLNRTFALRIFLILIIIASLNKCFTYGTILTKNNGTTAVIEHKHFSDYIKISYLYPRNLCVPSSPLDNFPELFTLNQLRHGAILLHIFGTIYFFVILAMVTNYYFLPTVECICEDLNIPTHLAAATFMASATAMPEFFTNTISTLITESDIGLGTIIGSLMFNTLGCVAVSSLFTKKPVQLDWWPVTRDSFIFFINILLLIVISWGDEISFWESAIMIVFLIFYYIVVFMDSRCMPPIRTLLEDKLNWCNSTQHVTSDHLDDNEDQLSQSKESVTKEKNLYIIGEDYCRETNLKNDHESISMEAGIFDLPRRQSIWRKLWWIYSLPIKILLKCLIPNPITHRKLYPLTFLMCIVVIGVNSYMIVWMLSIFGTTISLPEIVVGLTFLAAGSTMPETLSSVIAIRKGQTGIGVSNCLGSNSLAILLSLGVPWFIKNSIHYNVEGKNYIKVNSEGIEITVGILALSLISLYVILSIGRFRLCKRIGFILMGCYIVFTTIQVLIEMNIFFPSGNLCI